jgi:hypothetical protein
LFIGSSNINIVLPSFLTLLGTFVFFELYEQNDDDDDVPLLPSQDISEASGGREDDDNEREEYEEHCRPDLVVRPSPGTVQL